MLCDRPCSSSQLAASTCTCAPPSSMPSNATSLTLPVNPLSAPLQLKTRREPPPHKRLLRFAAGVPVNCPKAASVLATMTQPPFPTSSSVSRSRSRPTPASGSCAGSTKSASAPLTRSSCATAAKNPEKCKTWPGGRDGPQLQAPVEGLDRHRHRSPRVRCGPRPGPPFRQTQVGSSAMTSTTDLDLESRPA